MVAGTASLFLLFSVFMSASGDMKNITAESGQDVTLTCRAPNNKIKFVNQIIKSEHKIITAESGQHVTLTCRAPNNKITAVVWSRDDQKSEYVFYHNGHFDFTSMSVYQDGHFVPANQHPSFKNRVDLQDRQMKDGDVSLILKDVTINDTGTYECYVVQGVRNYLSLISIIHLIVVVPPDKIITFESGQDVTLTCRAPNNNIFSVMWSRADLGDENVFLYRDSHFVPDNQHPSFKNRVDLQDRQMKDGDVSLILKDVTINDTGTYECLVAQNSDKAMKLMSRSSLRVGDLIITAESGQDVTLTSRATNNNITAVHWSRADLGDEHLLFYRDGQFDPDNQHPSFKNRVDLQDRQMKDGDVSLILKDVTINDTGTYECRVFMNETRSWENSIIDLVVVPPELKIIPAESGQDVTLTCRAPNSNIRVVQWSRTDLRDENVLLYRDGKFDPDDQHPSFKNRVDLQDRQMKDGDVSLILKDVTINDTGTYECRVAQNSEKNMTLISQTSLRVADKIIIAESGQDVTLPFRAPNNKIISVEWRRDDLRDEYVLLYKNNYFDPDDQHPSFKNRVDLQDRQMKDGDVSLILNNVTINDTGTYECRVFMEESLWNLSIIHLHVVPPDEKNITAESGQDVTLTCRAPNNNITVVKWSRADLGDKNVFMYQDKPDSDNQDPSFKNRVDLQDRQMKDGDVSLILKDVTTNDAGTYECRVIHNVGGRMTLIGRLTLSVVDPPGPPRGFIGLIVVVLLLVGVGFLIYRKHKVSRYSNKVPTENNEALQAGLEITYK